MKINFYKGDLPSSFKATNIIALDSETMGLNPKRDKLCLVQVSNGNEVFFSHFDAVGTKWLVMSYANLEKI